MVNGKFARMLVMCDMNNFMLLPITIIAHYLSQYNNYHDICSITVNDILTLVIHVTLNY